MYQRVFKLLICLFCIKTNVFGASPKFVHQKDISEHCKRRVVPSIFLGQHVMDANSQIIQFSQLELPYSCSLSVRAEAGSNIILIIEFPSEESLMQACRLSGNQLTVYELGETFGGYWGHIPDVAMKESPKNYTQFYTLKTTRKPKIRTRTLPTSKKQFLKQTDTQSTTVEEQDYYTMDVPIVNISGNFQLGPRRETNDSEDLFNYIYDVTPRNGVEYETSILPLVQFSIRQQSNGYNDGVRRYELDYDSQGFTIDPRLIFNTGKKKKTSFRKDWKANRRFGSRTKSTGLFRRPGSKKKFSIRPPFANKVETTSEPTLDSKYLTNSWDVIDGIIKSIKVTTSKSTVFKNETFLNIIDNISNSHHNSSVYLSPNISIYNIDILTKENETILQEVKDSNQSVENPKNLVEIKDLGLPTTAVLPILEQKFNPSTLYLSSLKTAYDLSSINEISEVNTTDLNEISSLEGIQTDEINITYELNAQNELLTEVTTVPSTTTNKSINTSFLTGAMVDHESWENIVQAAPVMAVVLNNTDPQINNINNDVYNKRKHKRHIHALEIDQSRPRNLTTKSTPVSDSSSLDDVRDLARMLELQDDEIGSRVALRYVRHYVGPAMFNLCKNPELGLRQMFLINSSRIVIAVSNFTLDRLMIVLTPAQTLQSGVSQCPDGQLECQIVGTRVCIDSLNACDGVPNCGSYDIYDEERLTCGSGQGAQHSVYLAALTFLAVLLTAAYITLYWLERCVPRVSDAFFVYRDSSENELLLDSVMRSPNEDEDTSYKINYLGHFFEDEVVYQDLNMREKKVNFCKKIFYACWNFFDFRKISREKPAEKEITESELPKREVTKMYSFTQLELNKFGRIEFKEKGIQTGDSLELQELNFQKNQDKISLGSMIKFNAMANQHENKNITIRQDSELNIIKFSKESRFLSSQNDPMSFETVRSKEKKHAVGTVTDREIEIGSTIYDQVSPPRSTIRTYEVPTENKKMIESSKRLRFDDEPQVIPSIAGDDYNLQTHSSTTVNTNDDSHKTLQAQESEGSSSRLFWGAKGKKGRKKKLKYTS